MRDHNTGCPATIFFTQSLRQNWCNIKGGQTFVGTRETLLPQPDGYNAWPLLMWLEMENVIRWLVASALPLAVRRQLTANSQQSAASSQRLGLRPIPIPIPIPTLVIVPVAAFVQNRCHLRVRCHRAQRSQRMLFDFRLDPLCSGYPKELHFSLRGCANGSIVLNVSH